MCSVLGCITACILRVPQWGVEPNITCAEHKNSSLTIHNTSISPKVCGFYKSGWMESLLSQTQVDSVGPRVIVLHVARSEFYCVQEYVESINPGIYDVKWSKNRCGLLIQMPLWFVSPDLHLKIQPRIQVTASNTLSSHRPMGIMKILQRSQPRSQSGIRIRSKQSTPVPCLSSDTQLV